MKEYYCYKNGKPHGPFTLNELVEMQLSGDSLLWYPGLKNWKKLKEIPELKNLITSQDLTPPIPEINREASNKTLTYLMVWCSFHLFALLMSYSGIEVFNYHDEQNSDKFWPFVEFIDHYWYPHQYASNAVKKIGFNGIFTEYDWTEFAFYAGGSIIIYVINMISKSK